MGLDLNSEIGAKGLDFDEIGLDLERWRWVCAWLSLVWLQGFGSRKMNLEVDGGGW